MCSCGIPDNNRVVTNQETRDYNRLVKTAKILMLEIDSLNKKSDTLMNLSRKYILKDSLDKGFYYGEKHKITMQTSEKLTLELRVIQARLKSYL